MKRSQVYWLCQILGWSAHGVVNGIFAVLASAPPSRAILISVWGAGAAILCSHVFRGWIRRRKWLKLSPLQVLPRVFLASIVVGLVITALVTAGWPIVFGWAALRASGFGWVFPAIFIWSVTIFLWAVIYFGVHYFGSYKTAEMEKLRLAVVAKDAQLGVLLSQATLDAWARAHGRALTDAEQYAAVKMRLFQGFDELENLARGGATLLVDSEALETALALLGVD